MPTSIMTNPEILGGRPFIGGHRVRVSDVVIRHEYQGMSPDTIVSDLPSLTLADVHAALAYYYEHADEIRAEIHDERETADHLLAGRQSLVASKLGAVRQVS